jgi:signal peptidase I
LSQVCGVGENGENAVRKTRRQMPKTDKAISNRLRLWIIPGSIAVVLLFIMNLFVLKLEHVPSHDMKLSFNRGDVVLLNKLFKNFHHYDVLAFNYYEDDITDTMPIVLVQRCIALPGDTFEIEDGFVYINNKGNKYIAQLQHNYLVRARQELDSVFLKKYNLNEGGIISDGWDYSFSMNLSTADSLKKDSLVKKVQRNIEKSGFRDDRIFPADSNYKWNRHNYGKLYIPKKKDTLQIDKSNIVLYKKLISVYENNSLEIKGDSITINGIPTTKYVVKENYYFVMGDNRDNAMDSRYWGFLPERFIIGKVITRLKKGKPE